MDELPEDQKVSYKLESNKIQLSRNGDKNSIKSTAILYGHECFWYNKEYYCARMDDFILRKIKTTKHYYQREIKRIASRKIELVYKRSNSTGRIYNELVNFPSDILHLLRMNERPTFQIDLKTSQFLLIANVLNVYISEGGERLLKIFTSRPAKKFIRSLIKVLEVYSNQFPDNAVDLNFIKNSTKPNSSVIGFIRDVFSGNFYEIIQKEASLANREIAKDLIFKNVFGKNLKKSGAIQSFLNERYPVVMDIIHHYKELNDFKQFSIGLQAIESSIFIDKIYKPLARKGVPCFSRHDSIVVQVGREEEVERHMEQVFNSINFKLNYKVEGNFWHEIDRKEDYHEKYHKYFDIENAQAEAGENSEPEPFYNDADENSEPESYYTDAVDLLDDEQQKVIELLGRKGLLEDYTQAFESGNQLQLLLLLPDITKHQQEILEQEVVNLWSGHLMISRKASNIIREIASKYVC
jgi:hypothetical protein